MLSRPEILVKKEMKVNGDSYELEMSKECYNNIKKKGKSLILVGKKKGVFEVIKQCHYEVKEEIIEVIDDKIREIDYVFFSKKKIKSEEIEKYIETISGRLRYRMSLDDLSRQFYCIVKSQIKKIRQDQKDEVVQQELLSSTIEGEQDGERIENDEEKDEFNIAMNGRNGENKKWVHYYCRLSGFPEEYCPNVTKVELTSQIQEDEVASQLVSIVKGGEGNNDEKDHEFDAKMHRLEKEVQESIQYIDEWIKEPLELEVENHSQVNDTLVIMQQEDELVKRINPSYPVIQEGAPASRKVVTFADETPEQAASRKRKILNLYPVNSLQQTILAEDDSFAKEVSHEETVATVNEMTHSSPVEHLAETIVDETEQAVESITLDLEEDLRTKAIDFAAEVIAKMGCFSSRSEKKRALEKLKNEMEDHSVDLTENLKGIISESMKKRHWFNLFKSKTNTGRACVSLLNQDHYQSLKTKLFGDVGERAIVYKDLKAFKLTRGEVKSF